MLNQLIFKINQGFIYPFYHTVSNTELLHIKHLYKIKNEKDFRNDLDFFLRFYQPLSVDDVLHSINNKVIPSKPGFLLTFDDGLSQVSDVIAPILKEKGIPAVFFVNTGFIDNKGLFYRYKVSILIDKLIKNQFGPSVLNEAGLLLKTRIPNKEVLIQWLFKIDHQSIFILDDLASLLNVDFDEYLTKEKPYLSSEQINSLINDGFTIGSHSINHPNFSKLEKAEQCAEVSESVKWLQLNFKISDRLFSFPFTDDGISNDFFNKMFDTEHPLLDLSFGTAGLKMDSCERNLQRIPMEKFPHNAAFMVLFQYFYWLIKIPFAKNLIIRK
jgi:peptidoglycan/xylan/chitin deacetylase (PgdA/CDA1 family)